MTKSFLALLLVLSAATACGDDDADDGAPPPDATQVAPDAMPGAPIAYMEPCDIADDQCAEELLCFAFNNKGPHCTHACDLDGDCESPSTGCSGMKVCKVP